MVPGGTPKRRGILKWVLMTILVLLVAAAINREWVRFQIKTLLVQMGSTESRASALRWFAENEPEKAKHIFFNILLKDEDLRSEAIEGLAKSNQKELLPIYLGIWRDEKASRELKDAILKIVTDHIGEGGFFLYASPEMILSDESRYWALSYDFLNSNASEEMVNLLINMCHAGDENKRKALITALAYIKDNEALSGCREKLRSMLFAALNSSDGDIRFRALQAFGPVAEPYDTPFLLTLLDDTNSELAAAAGRILGYLSNPAGKNRAKNEEGMRMLALAASRVQEKGYPGEITLQLGKTAIGSLQGALLAGDFDKTDMLASKLGSQATLILEDIKTAKFVSFWNRYENSLSRGAGYSDDAPNNNFGVVISPEAGKLNYGQIRTLGAGKVMYVADIEAWEKGFNTEREKLLQHRSLAEKAGIEQVVRVVISPGILTEQSNFSTAFGRIIKTTRYGEGAKTKFFEISLEEGIDPVKAYKNYATLFREAVIIAKRLDSSIKLFLGPVKLGDARWYGSNGAMERIMLHSFTDGEQFRNILEGVSLSTDLRLSELETELSNFTKSFRIVPRDTALWCTGITQHDKELRNTNAHLERDFRHSSLFASELPACIALLSTVGVKTVFFSPFKDSPLKNAPASIQLNGLLYNDCMPKPAYHTARRIIKTLDKSELSAALKINAGPDIKAVQFPGKPFPVIIAWSDLPAAAARIKPESKFLKITDPLSDNSGNFGTIFMDVTTRTLKVPLGENPLIIEQVNEKPPPLNLVSQHGSFDILTKINHLYQPLNVCQKSYSSFDRSGGNDDGFSGTTSYLYRKENGEYVIFDARGPGMISRLWLGRTDGIEKISFYFDESEEPGIEGAPDELFGNIKFPFKYPLAASGNSAGGGSLLFLPVWFSRHLVIATTGKPKFSQVSYSLAKPSLKNKSTGLAYYNRMRGSISNAIKQISSKENSLHEECKPYTMTKEEILPPGDKVEIASLTGPALIRCLRVGCTNPNDMDHVLLQIHWDGSDTAGIGSPLADIFGQKYGTRHWQGVSMGFMGGEGYIHYPMPFTKVAKIILTNTGSEMATVSISVATVPLTQSEAGDRYLCCHWKTAIASPGEKVKLLSIKGTGHYVGCVMSAFSKANLYYLDSDIRIFADDMTSPLIHSTGIDDYFGGGNFYETGPFNLPYCGLLNQKDFTTVQYRLNIADVISFKKSFIFDIEELAPNSGQTVVSGAFFWYSEYPAGGD